MQAVEPYLPLIGQLTFGGLVGFLMGYALKKVGRVLAFALGLLLIVLAVLAYVGYITIDWERVQQDVNPLLEEENLSALWQKLLEVLTASLPTTSGFTVGFLLGLRKG